MNEDLPGPDEGDEPQDSAGPAPESVNSRKHERKESRIRREQQEADQIWKFVYDSEVGRREMWRLIAGADGAHAFETRFPVGPSGVPDANAAWHAKGEQDFGLRLYHACLKRNPQSVALMHQENDHRFAEPIRRKTGE